MRRAVIALFTVVVVGILFLVLCTFVKRPYETVLLNRFGSIISEKNQTRIAYNWYLKYPTDSVVAIDTRLHLYPTALQQVVTAGSEPIAVRTYAAWRIVDPVKFYTTTAGSDEKAQQIMGQKIGGLVQAKIANHRLDELFNTNEKAVHTAEIEKEIADEATNGSPDPSAPGGRSSGIQDQGLQIVQIGFSRMAFPPANAIPVYQRMASERTQQATNFRSEGESQATAIRADGDAEATKIRSEAAAEVGRIRGEGDRGALDILAKVQNSPSAREFYQYWKSLDFVKSSLTKNTYLVLPTTSDWLKSLFVSPAGEASNAQPLSAAAK